MSYFCKIFIFFILLSIVGINQAMAAGSGAFRNESPDAAVIGKGNAFVGEANTPAAVYYNPAGLNQIKSFEISAGGAFLDLQGSYKDNAGQETQSRRRSFLIPHVYAVLPVNEKLSLGFGSSSYWGLGTEWAEDSFSRYVATKTDLINTDTMLTASYKVTEQWALAVSLDNDDSKANEKKMAFQGGTPGSDGSLELKAKDNSWGYRLATLFKIDEKNQVGLMYRSAIHLRNEGKLYADHLNNLGPVPYNAIFGGSSYETRVSDKITLPQSVVLGYSFKPLKKWTFNIDIEWMNWSKAKQETITFDDETDPTRLAVLSAIGAIDHHWHSVFSEAIGAEYAATEKLRLRAGYYHHEHVIPQGTWQSSIPDASSHGGTLGFGYDLTQHLTLDLGYSALWYQPRKINNNVGTSVGSEDISGTYKQFVNDGLVTLTYKF
jgi:long-chain fatty acid transport protein